MRVVITGGAGFIGSRVARTLADEGHAVIVIDDLSFGRRSLLDPRCEFVEADIGDAVAIRPALDGADVVMHFAASSIIARSLTNPMEYVRNNVVAATTLLEVMREAGVRRMVFSSSAAVYGEPERVPVPEEAARRPLQMYGATKLAFEEILSAYVSSFGFDAVCLRYFNAYGPGDLQEPVTRAVPRWIRAALCGEALVTYWGGRQRRDYVYVDDIARAHVAVLGLTGFHAFNLGSGDGVIMADVAHTLERVLGTHLDLVDIGERPGDPSQLVADISRIQQVVGWQPTIGLEEGLTAAVAFYQATRGTWQAERTG
jgi:UDP-glucose 4-epimerase